ncbi:hypothetical protein GHI93_09300 [Lactococcus hircilactis]|uniref:Cell wall elongation regulator TseB-like domain-containing protein n=1 Tax=Lactococcus hircilactis TaxID=1494462 RepID=A0A7X1Z933_9LACT|nr:DUF5590 domain-containing protein [Lactococcus hircilactis]MQW40121.1 hypothetical protein [Lactococcus hircilactis]
MRKHKMSVVSQITIGILSVILAVYLAFAAYFLGATHPYTYSRQQVIAIAKEKAHLKTAEAFGVATTNETTYAVIGLDQKNKQIGVIVPEHKGNLTVVDLSKGVSPEQLKTNTTTSIVLGLYENKPVWQVNLPSGFKIYDFKSGHVILSLNA